MSKVRRDQPIVKVLSPGDFFRLLFPRMGSGEQVELRCRNCKTKTVHSEFFSSIPDLIARADELKNTHDVYFGPATRHGDRGDKQHCYRSRAVWADIDGCEQITDASPHPTIVVNSGSGLHAYWILQSQELVTEIHQQSRLEAINRGLAKRFKADNAIDVSRVLRVPGTFNHKYSPPRPVTAQMNGTGFYDRATLDQFAIIKPATGASDCDLSGGKIWRDLPQRITGRLNHVSHKPADDPSSDDAAVITAMLNHGVPPEDAYATFAASPRGADARKRKTGHFENYLQQTIRKQVGFMKANGIDTGSVTIDFGREHQSHHVTKSGIIAEKLHEVEPQSTEWLWKPYIPAGRITILAGDPGLGKSQIAIDLACRISRGIAMPASDQRSIGRCVIATAEDHSAETIVPRVIAAGGDRKRIQVIRKVMINGEKRYLSFPRDVQALHDFLSEGVRLLVIDPFKAFLGSGTDSHSDHDVRLALTPLEEIAENTGCAILVIHHLNKKEEASTLYRVGGSIGFIAAARSVLAVAKNEDRYVLYSLKANLSRRPPALQYQIEEKLDTSHVTWHGLSDFDPERSDDGPQRRKEVSDFLKQELQDGEVLATVVLADAGKVGIPARTLKRYKLDLGVRAVKRGDKWYWTW